MGVLLDGFLSWKRHIKYIENNISKDSGLLYKAKQFVHQRSILAVYYSYIHSNLDYANIAYGSKKDKLKKILTHRNHATRIISNKTHFDNIRELFTKF